MQLDSIDDAIKNVWVAVSFGSGQQNNQESMYNLITSIESQFSSNTRHDLEYWLGIAWRNYTAWFIRGGDKYPYVMNSINHLEKSYEMSIHMPNEVSEHERTHGVISRFTIAEEIGRMYIEEAMNISKGIVYLELIFKNSKKYYPSYCTYSEALYSLGEYEKAAEVALEAHQRAANDESCKPNLPPAPMRLAAKAYRARAKKAKKEGDNSFAIILFEKVIETGYSTGTDKRLLDKLKGQN